MARILSQLNDEVLISIIDLPEILEIQKLYHRETISRESSLSRIKYIVSSLAEYHKVANDINCYQRTHFNATFSLKRSH